VEDFNPRPREEGDGRNESGKRLLQNFNPRPREEGDSLSLLTFLVSIKISIHALVKRATLVFITLSPSD